MNLSRSREVRYHLTAILAIFLLAGVNIVALRHRAGFLNELVPLSPGLPRFNLFLIILVPLFLLSISLLEYMIYRSWRVPAPRISRVLEWSGILMLPFLGLMSLGARDPGRLLNLSGAVYLLMILVRMLGILFFSWRAAFDREGSGGRRLLLVIFALPFALYLGLSFWLVTTSSTTGDEPYYLMVAESLSRDGDLVLDNQFTPDRYGAYYWREYLAPQNMITTHTGLKSNAYNTLFPLMLAPASLIHVRWGPTIVVILLSSILASQIYLLCRDLTNDRRAASFAWGFCAFTLPLLSFSSQIYPETAAALVGVILFRLILKDNPGSLSAAPSMTGFLVPAVLLPALKIRYLPISLAALAIYLWRTKKPKAIMLVVSIAAAATALAVAVDQLFLDGTFILSRFSSFALIFKFRKLSRFFLSSMTGFFADQEFGLIVHSPIYLVMPAGLFWVVRRRDWRSLSLLLPASFYLVVLIGHFGHLWYGGFSQPSRYAIAVLPFWAPFLAWAWKEARGPYLKGIALFSFIWSTAVSVPYMIKPSMRYNQADGVSNVLSFLGGKLGIPFKSIFPSFMNPEAWKITGLLIVGLVLLVPSIPLVIPRNLDSKKNRQSFQRREMASLAMMAAFFTILGFFLLKMPTRVIEAESISHHGGKLYTGFGRGNVWVFDEDGWVEGNLITAREKNVLVIRAGARSGGSEASLTVYLDGRRVGIIPLNSRSELYLRQDYRLLLFAPAGNHSLRVDVTLPRSDPKAAVYLDRFTFVGQPG